MNLYDMIEFVTESLALQLEADWDHHKVLVFPLESYGIEGVQKCPNRKRREEQEVYGSLDKYGNCHRIAHCPVPSTPTEQASNHKLICTCTVDCLAALALLTVRAFLCGQAGRSGCSLGLRKNGD